MECLPRFDYGAEPADWSGGELGEAIARAPDGAERQLTTDIETPRSMRAAAPERCGCAKTRPGSRGVLGGGELGGPRSAPDAQERVVATSDFWRAWLLGGSFPDHPWRVHLQRSALVLKGLTYAPTGALVAAATTSLPETPGGERNWDYRYSWIRDSTFSLWALHTLGLRRGGARLRDTSSATSPATAAATCRSCTGSTASGT